MEYSKVDHQLLLELRRTLWDDQPLSVSLARVLHARGWVSMPGPQYWICAVFDDEDDEIGDEDGFAVDLVWAYILPAGVRELELHTRRFPDLNQALWGIGVDGDLDEPEDTWTSNP